MIHQGAKVAELNRPRVLTGFGPSSLKSTAGQARQQHAQHLPKKTGLIPLWIFGD
jgi:hypothetical protein